MLQHQSLCQEEPELPPESFPVCLTLAPPNHSRGQCPPGVHTLKERSLPSMEITAGETAQGQEAQEWAHSPRPPRSTGARSLPGWQAESGCTGPSLLGRVVHF